MNVRVGQESAQKVVNKSICQVCTFKVAGRTFGVDILDVKEINSETSFTPVFHAPPQVKGYVNIRGQIHLVLDLRSLLGFSREEVQLMESSRLVIFKHSVGEAFAVLVDGIGDIVSVEQDNFEPVQNFREELNGLEHARTDLMLGVCRQEEDLLVILDAPGFLQVLDT